MKITDLLGVLKTNNEDDDDIQTRADFDNDGEGSPSKQDLEIPASRNPLPSSKKQLTSTIVCRDGDRGFASEVIASMASYCCLTIRCSCLRGFVKIDDKM